MAYQRIKLWQQMGHEVVFTNGCFDILHAGHVQYLHDAAALGCYLVVGLNADASVMRLKGRNRPIIAEHERALVLAALACVDLVVIFEEDTPELLINTFKPDILVKGGDYKSNQIVGAQLVESLGGKVLSLPFYEGHSTSSIEQRIKTGLH